MAVSESLCRGALLLIAASLASCRAKPPAFTNLVVLVVDTLRSDHLPSYGYARETAPHLRRWFKTHQGDGAGGDESPASSRS